MADKEFVCEICGETFDNGVDWEKHNRNVHSRFTCETCQHTFGAEDEFASHNFKMHPELQKIQR